MRPMFKAIFIASVLSLAVPTLTHARAFEHTIAAPLSSPVKIEVVLSEDMQHRANNLAKKISDRNFGASRGARAGFGNNGYYGEKDLERLTELLEKRMVKKFAKKGIILSDDAPVTMRITIEDAKNNRPTFKQLSVQPSLSFNSFGTGGAELSADLIGQDGTSLGTMHYRYFEQDLRFNQQFSGIWQDANRSFARFANHAAKHLSN